MKYSKLTTMPISQWSVDDRPRDKMLSLGLSVLSNSELLSILISTGDRDIVALEQAKAVLSLAANNLSELGKLSLNDLQKAQGIGLAKACLIAVAIELGRRREIASPLERIVIKSSSDLAQYLKVMLKDYSCEVFAVVFLNRANKIKHFEIVSSGGISGTVADPRIILKRAVEQEASSLVLSHNHPSGNLKPSRADMLLTSKIKQAASYLDITVLDHIIVSDEGYYSFADEGEL